VFARVGSFAVRFRWFIIAAWVAVAIALTLLAPNINDVANSDQRSFLPSHAPSLTAHEIVTKYFPDRVSPSSAVIVIDAGPGGRVDEATGSGYVAALTTWLSSAAASDPTLSVVDRVVSPANADEQTKAGLVSADKQVALALVRFSTIGTQPETQDALATIRSYLAGHPAGLETYTTGDGPILAAYNEETQSSVDSTTRITIILVIVILLLIYRSPVSPFIPLITIALAYLIARGVVAFLGAHVMTISAYTNIFIIVVLFGAGTDYCLFLISRFREEMTGVKNPEPAVKSTVRAVGETIASSAGTVIVGVAMMATAELGLYNTSGPSLAIAVLITLLAGLTLTPAMLRVLGHHAFWPRKAHRMKEAGIWSAWAAKVVKRPWVAFLIPVIVLVPLAWYGSGLGRDFDLLADLPKDNEQRLGFDVLAEHFGAGQMQPLNVVVVNPDGADTPAGLTQAQDLETKLATLPHVAMIRSLQGSLPDAKTLNVADQLATVKKSVDDGATALEHALDGGSAASNRGGPMSAAGATSLQAAASQLKDVAGYLVQIAQAYPDATQNSGYVQAIGALSQLATLGQQFSAESGSSGTTGLNWAVVEQALAHLKGISQGLGTLQEYFATQQPDAILLPDLYLQSNSGLKALRDAYLSADGTAARLQVVLDSGPYSPEAIAAVQAIEKTLHESGVEGYVEGNSAVLLDLREASDRDMTKAFIFVLGGIFVVLLLLLRALVAPIYLILTILLSYAGTLGVMRLIFVDIMHTGGVTWWVPMFMFVMLVALGMDYNIFLIGRVKEEVATSGTRDGTRHALARTGGIITSAGIIMAGTFASMMSGSILGLLQIGFAVAFGVLLDTFVVRTTLVPAIIVLLGRWSWWPRRGPAGHKPVDPVELPPVSEKPSISE
jgi:putative drug exporter of the RND superfamily